MSQLTADVRLDIERRKMDALDLFNKIYNTFKDDIKSGAIIPGDDFYDVLKKKYPVADSSYAAPFQRFAFTGRYYTNAMRKFLDHMGTVDNNRHDLSAHNHATYAKLMYVEDCKALRKRINQSEAMKVYNRMYELITKQRGDLEDKKKSSEKNYIEKVKEQDEYRKAKLLEFIRAREGIDDRKQSQSGVVEEYISSQRTETPDDEDLKLYEENIKREIELRKELGVDTSRPKSRPESKPKPKPAKKGGKKLTLDERKALVAGTNIKL